LNGARAERPVLVTGGTGFIGRHLVAALRARDVHVRALVRRADAAAPLAALGAEIVVGDLLDSEALRRASVGVRSVFHLAGRLFAPGAVQSEYARLHVAGTVALLRECLASNKLDFFLLCSTTGVHGPTGAVPAREDDARHPQNAYEVTKAEAEVAVASIARRAGVPLAIARPGLVYGPGDGHLLGWFRAIRHGYYRVIGRGRNRLHPIFVDDLVRGLLLTADAATPDARAYHLVGAEAVTMRELSDAIGTAVGRPVPRTHLPVPLAYACGAAMEALPIPRRVLPLSRSRVRFMLQNRAYDGSRARNELGFSPRIGLAEGLSRTVAWYRSEGVL
jgi:nucleoside-diphosphate-sugar epimerase